MLQNKSVLSGTLSWCGNQSWVRLMSGSIPLTVSLKRIKTICNPTEPFAWITWRTYSAYAWVPLGDVGPELNFQRGFNINSLFRNYPTSVVLGFRNTYTIQAHLHRNISCTKIQSSLQGLATQISQSLTPGTGTLYSLTCTCDQYWKSLLAPLSKFILSAANIHFTLMTSNTKYRKIIVSATLLVKDK